MTTRASTPRRRSALGSAPSTSPRPPVFAKGETSEATNRTLGGWRSGMGFGGGRLAAPEARGLASGRVYAIVGCGEDIVARLEVRHVPLVQPAALQIVVQACEALDVLVEAARRV